MSDVAAISREALRSLDSLFEHRIRLAIGSLLSEVESLTFSRFKELLQATNGNLGAQLRKLEDAGYVEVRKDFVGRQPTSSYSLSSRGRTAFHEHVRGLRLMIGLGFEAETKERPAPSVTPTNAVIGDDLEPVLL